MFAGKISNPPSTPGVGVPGLRQLQWLQPRAPHRTASQHRTGPPASTMQDCQPWPRPRQHPRAVAGRSLPRDASCSPSTRARHAASLAICLSAEASEIPFNVNISSKAFHFLTYNTFNIPLASLGQLPRLCSLPASCTPACWQSIGS